MSEYPDTLDAPRVIRRPLILACSGGGGHLSAAEGLIAHLKQQHNVDLPVYVAPKPRSFSFMRGLIKTGIWMQSISCLRPLCKTIGLAYLPDPTSFFLAWQALQEKNQNTRPYIDVLLDFYPAGYVFAAVFNALQMNDQVLHLQQAINHQPFSDRWHHRTVYHRILTLLQHANNQGKPYTEIMSTQSQSLQAICDAVCTYNKTSQRPITIHQYMTDLPTANAIHFMRPLNRLTPRQKQHMHLMMMGELSQHTLKKPHAFQCITQLNPLNNPMVKPGFQYPGLDQYLCSEKPMSLTVLDEARHSQKKDIAAHDRVLSIMLGSLGGHAMVEYVRQVLKHPHLFAHVFLFRGHNTNIDTCVRDMLAQQTGIKPQIHLLCFQTDTENAPILTRSDVIVLRSGGLSTMEAMSLPTKPGKTLLIHHPQRRQNQTLSTGLLWEDANAEALKQFMIKQGGIGITTNPSLFEHELNKLKCSWNT